MRLIYLVFHTFSSYSPHPSYSPDTSPNLSYSPLPSSLSYSPLPTATPPPPGSPASLHLRLEEAQLQLRAMER